MNHVLRGHKSLDRTVFTFTPHESVKVEDEASRVTKRFLSVFGFPDLLQRVVPDVLRPPPNETFERYDVAVEERTRGFLVVRPVSCHAREEAADGSANPPRSLAG